MMESLPEDIVSLIFDKHASRDDGRGAAATCHAWNRAWYGSAQWGADNPLTIQSLSVRTVDSVVRALTKAAWRPRHVVIAAATVPVHVIVDIVRRLKNLEALYVLCAHPGHVILETPLPAPKLRSLTLLANTWWHAEPGAELRNLTTLEHLSIARHWGQLGGRDLPPNLRSLEMIECCDLMVRGHAHLESLTIIESQNCTAISMDECPALRRVSVCGASDVTLVYAEKRATLMVKPPPNFLPWDMHFMPEDRSSYPMHVADGARMAFVTELKKMYTFVIVDKDHVVVKARNV